MLKRVVLLILSLNLFVAHAQIIVEEPSLISAVSLSLESKKIDEHGVHFFENEKILSTSAVRKNFAFLAKQLKVDLKNYSFNQIKKGKHVIKLWETKQSNKPFRIVEVVTQDSSKSKRIPITEVRLLILSKSSPYRIELEVDNDGIAEYYIGKRSIHTVRESILFIDDEVDNSAFKEAELI
jgi:hypothetical protein